MMNLTTDRPTWSRRATSRPALLVGAAVLLVVVVLGALAGSGTLAPVFWRSGGGGGNGHYFAFVDNESWRGWTVTARFADGRDTEQLPSLGTVTVSLFANRQLATDDADPLRRITVADDGQFAVGVSVGSRSCNIETTGPGRMIVGVTTNVSVLLDVATPLGTRTIPEIVGVECDRSVPATSAAR